MNIAVVLPNWVGDAVMATPALQALRAHFGSSHHLIGVMRPLIADVLGGSPWLDEIIPLERRGGSPESSPAGVARQLREQSLDTMILMTNSFSTGWLAWRSGARRRVGFARHGRGWLLTDRLRAPRQGRRFVPRSAIDHYVELAEAVGCRNVSKQLALHTTPQDEADADAIWDAFQLHGQRVVVCNTGGAYGPAKTWPAAYFAELAQRISDEADAAVLVICGPAEQREAEKIADLAAHPRVHSLAGHPLRVGLSKACVRRAALMISTDSGPRHFAPAFDVPAIGIYGPTDPRWSESYHPQSISLQQSVPCGPCGKRQCPLEDPSEHHQCMRELDVQRVFSAAQRVLHPHRSPNLLQIDSQTG